MSRKNKTSVLVLVFILTASLVSCGGGGDGDTGLSIEELEKKIFSMNVSDVQGFVITGEGGNATQKTGIARKLQAPGDNAIDLDANSIYKVTVDGRLERVPVNDADGNEAPRGTIRPVEIKDVNSDYLFMKFFIRVKDRINGNQASRIYLVHKRSGLAYNATDIFSESSDIMSSLGPSQRFHSLVRGLNVHWDQTGNLYAAYEAQGLEPRLVKIDTTNLEAGPLTAEILPFTQGNLRDWEVSPDGSFVVYRDEGRFSQETAITRFLNVETGILFNLNVAVEGSFNHGFFRWVRALDGRIYGLSSSEGVYRIEMADDGGPRTVLTGQLVDPSVRLRWPTAFDRQVVGGKLLYIAEVFSSNFVSDWGLLLEVQPERATTVSHPIPTDLLGQITDFGTTADFVFFLGVEKATSIDTILRYNPATGETVLFKNIVDFDISRFKIMSNNKVWFSALRLSDQATVAGEIDVNGVMTIIDVKTANEPDIILMVPINIGDFLVVDGSTQEWPLNLRLLTDVVGDHTTKTSGDLTAYSQRMSATTYTALVEFNGPISIDIEVEVILSTEWAVKITRNGGSLVDRIATTESSLNGAGGLFAIGEALEFSVPLSAIGNPASVSPAVTARDLVDDGAGNTLLIVADQMP